MRMWIGLAAVLGIALQLGSCAQGTEPTGKGSGGDDTSGSSSSSGGTAGASCPAFAKSECTMLQSCSAVLFAANYADLATCETRRAASCELRAKAPGTSFNDTKIKACTAQYDALTCADFTNPAVCTPTAGTLADGAACGDDFQCQSTFCNRTNGTCGVCAPRFKLGDSCASNSKQCEVGLVCNGTCQMPVAENGSCTSSPQCLGDLYCNGATGQCMKKPSQMNATCDPSVGCDLVAGLWCDSNTLTCKAITVVQAGASCSLSSSFTICAAGGLCANQVCVAPLPDSMSCDVSGNPPCETMSECRGGKCQLIDPASCSTGSADLCAESCVDSQGSAAGMNINGTIHWTQSNCACSGLKSGLPVGSACSQASDCVEVCCPCCTGTRSFQVQACVAGKCIGPGEACPLAKSTSADGNFNRIQCD